MFNNIPTKGSTAIIIGTRHNPQLGSYLNACIIGSIQRVGQPSKITGGQTITVKYQDFMGQNLTKSFDSHGYEKKHESCVYGGVSHHMYLTKDSAIEALKQWTNNPNEAEHRKETARSYITKIEAAA